MSRVRECILCTLMGFPRVSGDEPFTLVQALDEDVFSPRERG